MSQAVPETVRSQKSLGRYAIAVMVKTDAGWRFLRDIRRQPARPTSGKRGGKAKKLLVRTSWSLAGAALYMPVDDAKLTSVLRDLKSDGRTAQTIDVLCAEAPPLAPPPHLERREDT